MLITFPIALRVTIDTIPYGTVRYSIYGVTEVYGRLLSERWKKVATRCTDLRSNLLLAF